MSISAFEMYHGIVLSQVVRNTKTSLKLIEKKEDQAWGAYKVMDNVNEYLLYVKYSSKDTNTEKRKRFNFTFTPEDMKRIERDRKDHVLVCLVCGREEVCVLTEKDLDELELWNIDKTRNVSVYWVKGSSLSVRSKGRDLPYKIPRNRLRNFEWK